MTGPRWLRCARRFGRKRKSSQEAIVSPASPPVLAAATGLWSTPAPAHRSRAGAGVLSEYTEAVATRLHLLAPKVILLGGLFQRDSVYTHAFRRKLKKNMPDARVAMSEQSPELGAAWLAAEMEERVEAKLTADEKQIAELSAALT